MLTGRPLHEGGSSIVSFKRSAMKESPLDRISTLTGLDPPRRTDPSEIATETYRSLLQQAGDGFLVVSKSENILDINAKACELLGYEMEELLGRPHGRDRTAETAEQEGGAYSNAWSESSLACSSYPCSKAMETRCGWSSTPAGSFPAARSFIPALSGMFRRAGRWKRISDAGTRNCSSSTPLRASSADPSILKRFSRADLEKVLSLLDIEAGYIPRFERRNGRAGDGRSPWDSARSSSENIRAVL